MIEFKKVSGFKILFFCWDNPLVEGYYLNLFNEIAKKIEIFPVAIVTSFLSKLRFVKKSIHAFTYQELINFSLESYRTTKNISHRFRKEILEDLSDYDMKMRWKWLPPQKILEKSYYLFQSSVIVQAYDFFWRHFRPDMAITWNGVALFQKALAFLAHTYDVPVLFLERGLLPQTLYVDTKGVNFKSSIAGGKWINNKFPRPNKRKIIMAKDFCQKLKNGKESVVNIGDKISIEEIKKKLDIRASSKVILFPMQIEADSNILYFSPHYSNMIEIIKDIQRIVAHFSDIDMHLIVKPHPEDRNRLNELRSLTNNNTHILDGVNLYSLLELADLVITVNSTVGLEALIFQKPVIVLGKAIYSEKGFTYDLSSRRELSNLVRLAIEKHTLNDKNFYSFLIHILEQKLFHLDANQDYWKSRNTIVKKIVELLQIKKRNNVTVNTILLNKLSKNIKFQKIFTKGKIVILGLNNKKLEGISRRKGEKIVNSQEAIKFLLYNLFSKKKPDLVLTSRPLSLKRRILLKLIHAEMKVLLPDNDINFFENETKDFFKI